MYRRWPCYCRAIDHVRCPRPCCGIVADTSGVINRAWAQAVTETLSIRPRVMAGSRTYFALDPLRTP